MPTIIALLILSGTIPTVHVAIQARRNGQSVSLPAVTGYVFISIVAFALVILTSADFLGIGVQAPATSWGLELQSAMQTMQRSSYLLVAPALLLTVTLFCLMLIHAALYDHLDFLHQPATQQKVKNDSALFDDVNVRRRETLFDDVSDS